MTTHPKDGGARPKHHDAWGVPDGLAMRTFNCLVNKLGTRHFSPQEVAALKGSELLAVPAVGYGTLANIQEWLAGQGLALRPEDGEEVDKAAVWESRAATYEDLAVKLRAKAQEWRVSRSNVSEAWERVLDEPIRDEALKLPYEYAEKSSTKTSEEQAKTARALSALAEMDADYL